LKGLAGILGLLQRVPTVFLQGARAEGLSAQAIEGMIAERGAAKKARDFATADRIRDELKAGGVILEDGPAGTSWRRE
jgi:cysteinyl-tRNA synthetase